tara:strand:+ start:135 stop:476 length:342 start_codon:yes stop_codon:yes gene_type:complete
MKYEGLAFSLFPDPILKIPLHWRVIYTEGIRKNHILFTESDLKRFAKQNTIAAPNSQMLESIAPELVKLYSYSNISEMKNFIAKMPFRDRFWVYTYYCRTLAKWQHEVASLLN